MENFYAENHLKKSGQGAGGKFNRPSIKHILKEENLCQLENMLPVSASAFISYLRSLRNLHELCVGEELGNYQAVLYDFQTNNYYYKNMDCCQCKYVTMQIRNNTTLLKNC